MKRIKWEYEEMVAMVDLYYNFENGTKDNLESELKKLSEKLQKRADSEKIQHDEKYRNLNGLRMIYENIRYVDTNGMKGLSSASQLVYDIVRLYNEDRERFRETLEEFNSQY